MWRCLFNERSIIGSGTIIHHSVTIGEVRGKVTVIGKIVISEYHQPLDGIKEIM